jgi:hypothetical protein
MVQTPNLFQERAPRGHPRAFDEPIIGLEKLGFILPCTVCRPRGIRRAIPLEMFVLDDKGLRKQELILLAIRKGCNCCSSETGGEGVKRRS